MAGKANVLLDGEGFLKRNSVLFSENAILRNRLKKRDSVLMELVHAMSIVSGVHEMGIVEPGEVRKLYTAIDDAIEAFLEPMDQYIRQSRTQRDRITGLLQQPAGFANFRLLLQRDAEFRGAALDPYTKITDIWTAFIWRMLNAVIFREAAVQPFYTGDGQNAANYMRHVDEIVDLMKLADPPVFGEYATRLWRRQALAAIFRTAKFDWLEKTRAASIERVSRQILTAFDGFTRSTRRDQQLGLVRNIVEAAVRLNEYVMIEADDVWTVQIAGFTGGTKGDFWTMIQDFDLKPVGTTAALRDIKPLDTISDRLNPQELRNRVRPLCTLAPALQFRSFISEEEHYDSPTDLVKPRVLVSVRQAAPAGGAQVPAAAPPDEQIFYTLAQNMGLVK